VSEIISAILSIDDARVYLGGMSRATFYKLRDKFEWVKLGKRSYVTRASLDRAITGAMTEDAR
jgi:hypothetical protein